MKGVEINPSQLTPVKLEVDGKTLNLRTDFSQEALKFIQEETQATIQKMREFHPDLPTEHIYLLAALNLAGQVYEKQQEIHHFTLQVEEMHRLLGDDDEEPGNGDEDH